MWWLFYLSGTNVLSSVYSSDFVTWSAGSTLTLSQAHGSEGRSFGLGYTNLAGVDVLHSSFAYPVQSSGSAGSSVYHARLTLGTTTFSVTNAQSAIASDSNANTGTMVQPGCPVTLLAVNGSSGTITDVSAGFHQDGVGNLEAARSINADSGTSWTAGFAAAVNMETQTNSAMSYAVADLGSGNVLAICDNNPTNGNFTNLRWSKWTTSWSAAGAVFGSNVTSTNVEQWGIGRVSATDVHAITLSNNSNTIIDRRFNGTNWTTLAVQTIPNLTLHATSGLCPVTNGTDLWLFAIDSSNNVKYIKWTAATPAWDASWTTLEAGGANARTYITGAYSAVDSLIGVVWTEVNGASNYNIAGSTLSLSTAAAAINPPPPFPGIPQAMLVM